jgi:hypothetical protein
LDFAIVLAGHHTKVALLFLVPAPQPRHQSQATAHTAANDARLAQVFGVVSQVARTHVAVAHQGALHLNKKGWIVMMKGKNSVRLRGVTK